VWAIAGASVLPRPSLHHPAGTLRHARGRAGGPGLSFRRRFGHQVASTEKLVSTSTNHTNHIAMADRTVRLTATSSSWFPYSWPGFRLVSRSDHRVFTAVFAVKNSEL